ncbi:uncharacterized protein EI90DRAFT_3132424 [Cantharellus anzutake]|uniref:uncharacterized protein n=1 Tax=Cantharellus anzutake TaxID=1750568 RepID=UPI001907313D|nr:uncharacterized protein EI90DRAFT_3132424 [Cantharellus anzutake]KAF8319562.1 hypothetical protein EI90DRAFT_3132424 [Cantharellus anzutake]
MVDEGEMEVGEEEGPSGLASIQPLGHPEIAQDAVIGLGRSRVSYPYIPDPDPTPGPPTSPPPESYPISVCSNTHLGPNITPLATLLLLLLLLFLMTPPPFHHSPTLLPSAPILTFRPDTFPLLHSSPRSSLLSPPSDPLPPLSRTPYSDTARTFAPRFHHTTSDFDSTSA